MIINPSVAIETCVNLLANSPPPSTMGCINDACLFTCPPPHVPQASETFIPGFALTGTPPEGAEKLRVGSHSFKTVQSQLLLLSLLADYLVFLDTIPGLAMEVAHRLVELVKVPPPLTHTHFPSLLSILGACCLRFVEH